MLISKTCVLLPSPRRVNSKQTTNIPIKTRKRNSSPRRKKKPTTLLTVSGQFAAQGNLPNTCIPALPAPRASAAPTHAKRGPTSGHRVPSTPNAAGHLEQSACAETSRSLSSRLPSLEPSGLFSNSSPPFLTCWPSPPATPRGGIHWLEFPKTRGTALPPRPMASAQLSWRVPSLPWPARCRPLLFIRVYLSCSWGDSRRLSDLQRQREQGAGEGKLCWVRNITEHFCLRSPLRVFQSFTFCFKYFR